VGVGTVMDATTLSRDRVLSSSNFGALVNFSAGVKDVFVSQPASRAGRADAGMLLHESVIYSDVTIPDNHNAGSFGPVTVATGKTVTVNPGSVWTVI
jgi:hypothetical protein